MHIPLKIFLRYILITKFLNGFQPLCGLLLHKNPIIPYFAVTYQLQISLIMFQTTLIKALTRVIPISVLLISGLWSCSPSPDNSYTEQQISGITPLFEHAQMPAHIMLIQDPTNAYTLPLPSGGELRIPANCFVNEAGERLTGPVSLRYREFHDATDIIAAGIPMKALKPNGTSDWLQTAGMFELRGDSEGNPIRFADNKSAEIVFLSSVDGPYDTWILNEYKGLWENLGESNTPRAIAPSPESAQREIEHLGANPPQAPKATPPAEQLVFSDLDLSQTPELKSIANLAFAYAGDDPKLDPKRNKWITKEGIWVKKEIKPTDNPGIYQLTLVGEEYFSIPVKKAIQIEDQEAALAAYHAELATYQANLDKLKSSSPGMTHHRFIREMRIQGFGIYNYDIFLNQDKFIPLAADFDLGDLPLAEKKEVMVFHITANGKAVLSLTSNSWSSFKFNPDMDNGLLAILPDNRVAMFTASDFKASIEKIKRAGGRKFVFPMDIQMQPINSFDELKTLLNKAAS